MKGSIKNALRKIGLFQPATNLIDSFRSLKSFPKNLKYRFNKSPDELPIPPDRLIYKVTGSSSIYIFFISGKWAAESIESALITNKIELRNFSTILDFGCGCGRVIRWMKDLTDAQLFGCDFNYSLVEWCRHNLKFGQFVLNQVTPPLKFAANSFDLIYALSVFTHMDERLQQSWISEFIRILKKGGYLLFSVHGKHYMEQLSDAEKKEFNAGNLVTQSGGALGSNRFAAYHPLSYLKNSIPNELVFVDFIEKGAKGNPYQDLYLFKRRED